MTSVEEQMKQHERFSPYTDNGGTSIAVAGDDYVVVASETRLSSGYSIYTRDQSKLFQITPQSILASSGCWCDSLTFVKVIEMRVKNYLYDHNRTISTTALGQLVSTMLYYKRFFPYYVSNMVAGLDDDGRGIVYHYDPVGSFEPLKFSVAGSAAPLIQPFLDSIFDQKNTAGLVRNPISMPVEEAIKVVKDIFVAAGERDIYIGDQLDIRIITRAGTQQQMFKLRRD